jgi:hypothetical protein
MSNSDLDPTCIVSFLVELFRDMGAGESEVLMGAAATLKSLQAVINLIRRDRIVFPGGKLTDCLNKASKRRVKSLERYIVIALVIIITISIIFIIVFLSSIFHYRNPEWAIVSFFIFIVSIGMLHRYSIYRIKTITTQFGSEITPCFTSI